MKKLLSALFILGSVTMLANECYETMSCQVEKEITLAVRIPKKLKMMAENINFGTWCGTKTLTKQANYSVEGEPGAHIQLKFENSNVNFTHESGAPSGFSAALTLDKTATNLHATLGTTSGIVTAQLNPLSSGNPLVGNHVAKAKLIAEYDQF